VSVPTSKVCTGCGERKSLDAFHRQRAHWTGRTSRCRICTAAIATERRERGPAPSRLAAEEAEERRHAVALALAGSVRAGRIVAAVDRALNGRRGYRSESV